MPRPVSVLKDLSQHLRFSLIGSQTLRKQLLKYANMPFSGEDWEKSISVCSSALSPGVITSYELFATIPLNL